jgi:hypothetical protein
MASIGQLELWQNRAKTRVDTYKGLVKTETAKKKSFLRPKSPQQIKAKEAIVKKVERYREELSHSQKRLKEIEGELKEARKSLKASTPKSPKSVSKVLSKKFSKTTAKRQDTKAAKAADNRIVLDVPASSSDKDKSFRLLQDIMGVLNSMDERLKRLEQKSDDRHQKLAEDVSLMKAKVSALS